MKKNILTPTVPDQPADTMQPLQYTGPPRARDDKSQRTGNGAAAIPYQGATGVQSPDSIGLGGYGV